MKTHVGVDLHQRFCYLTAVDASGKLLRQGQVANQAAALQQWLGSLESPRQVVVEASGFWPAFHRAARSHAEVDRLDAEIGLQTRELERLAACDVRARWLQTVPGIGAYSAMVMLAEMGEVGRFRNKQALASYAGLVPVVRESAGRKKRGGITHQGSNTLRWIMLQVAQVSSFILCPAVNAVRTSSDGATRDSNLLVCHEHE